MYSPLSEISSDSDTMGSAEAKEGTNLIDPNKANGKARGSVGGIATEKTQYPRCVFFIIGNEFCERFCFYGMRAILVLYLTGWLQFNNDQATAIYHTFTMLCYFTPILGAILADGYIGRYRTILYLSLVYVVGNILMSFTAFPPPFWLGPMIALLMVGVGTGGIKPCVSAFGGDQFSSDQEKERTQFFSVFYFAINLGSLFSMILTPVLRAYVTCFGTNCFPLAFGVPAVLMVIAVVLFVCGRSRYKRVPATGNIIGQTFFCVGRALKNRCLHGKQQKEHWLEYADDKYESGFITDVKLALSVMFLFIPLPMFWALFDQQGSRWILQAEVMDGAVFGGLEVLPDQMPALNAVLIILFIPLFETVIYPILAKCHLLQRALQRMVAGMGCAGFAFILAAILQIQIDAHARVSPAPGTVGLHFVNAAPCPVHITSPVFNYPLFVSHATDTLLVPVGPFHAGFHANEAGNTTCEEMASSPNTDISLDLKDGNMYYVVLASQNATLRAKQFSYLFKDTMPESGGAMVNLVYSLPLSEGKVTVLLEDRNKYQFNVTQPYSDTSFIEMRHGEYKVTIETGAGTKRQQLPYKVKVTNGGVYSIIIQPNVTHTEQVQHVLVTVSEPNELSIFWQVPQYVVITAGEIMFSISGLEFSYSQAPASMKSLLQAAWLLNVSIGNLVDVIVAGAQIFNKQSNEFFLFAGLMFLCTIVFAVMTCFYTYVPTTSITGIESEADNNTLIGAENPSAAADDYELHTGNNSNIPGEEAEDKTDDSSVT